MLPGDVGNMAHFHISTTYSKTMHGMSHGRATNVLPNPLISLHEKKKHTGA